MPFKDLQKDYNTKIGSHIKIEENIKRHKVSEEKGILKEVYRSVFIVEIANEKGILQNRSYNFSDVVTNAVRISFE